MVCYFILRHIFMIGSHRPVRRQGRKPGASSPTRRKLGRGGGRRQITKCYLSLAVLPDHATGTTGQRYYRPRLPLPTDDANRSPRTASSTTGSGTGTTGQRHYRPQLPPLLTTPTEVPGLQAVLPDPEAVLPVVIGQRCPIFQ